MMISLKRILCRMTVVSVAVLALLTVSCSTSRPRVSFVPTRPTVGMSSRLDMIDVSHHNGAIDWNTVSRQVGYAYIKATEGYHFVDDKYAINRDEARRHGVKTGPYHYFRLNHPAREQFENFRKTVGKKLDLVPMIDLEMDNNNRDRYTPGNLYPEETANLLEFLRMVEKEYKVTPVLYVGGDQFYRIFIAPSAELRAYPQWRRSIGDTLKRDFGPEDNVVIWQYNGAGRLDGIDHDVDMNMILDPGSVVKK